MPSNRGNGLSEETIRRHRQDKRARANAQRKLHRYETYWTDSEDDYWDHMEAPESPSKADLA